MTAQQGKHWTIKSDRGFERMARASYTEDSHGKGMLCSRSNCSARE